MRLKNLQIIETNITDKDKVIDAINELDIIISDNYDRTLEREISIEFNIHSRLGEPREYLVVYVNPKYKNNPYVFILTNNDNVRELVDIISLDVFRDLSDDYIRQEVNKTIATGFKRLPEYAFLSEEQINNAREYVKKYNRRNH